MPERYRAAVVLCLLEGLTPEQAAQQLNCPVGTVHSRLARGRAPAERLSRRDLTIPAVLPGGEFLLKAASASVPHVLVDSTAKAAVRFAAGKASVGAVPASVVVLAKEVLKSMSLLKLKQIAAVFLMVSVLAVGAGRLAFKVRGDQQAIAQREEPRAKTGLPQEELAQRVQSINNMKKLGLALNLFSQTNGYLVPNAIRDPKTGIPLLSWRVELLPWIGEQDLFKKFNFTEPWDGPHNKALLAEMPKVYAPVRGKTKEPYCTFYQAFVGPGTAFEPLKGSKKMGFPDMIDGAGNTVAFVEGGEAVPWTKPEDLPYAPDKPLPRLGGLFDDGFHFVLLDASACFLMTGSDRAALDAQIRALITRAGGENFDRDNLFKAHLGHLSPRK